ncbi:hypothetical protein N2152v2_000868 [Parachlorella kessleri]
MRGRLSGTARLQISPIQAVSRTGSKKKVLPKVPAKHRARCQAAHATEMPLPVDKEGFDLRLLEEGPRLLPYDARSPTCSQRLFRAAIQGNWDMVVAMLSHGTNVNQPVTTFGHNLLHFAAQGALWRASADSTLQVVQALLEAGADVGATDVRGNTCLHQAALGGWSASYGDGMRALLAAGADATLRNKEGKTALHLAAERGRAEAVRVLVEVAGGAVVGAVTLQGQTAEQLARQQGHEAVAEYLQQAAARLDAGAPPAGV